MHKARLVGEVSMKIMSLTEGDDRSARVQGSRRCPRHDRRSSQEARLLQVLYNLRRFDHVRCKVAFCLLVRDVCFRLTSIFGLRPMQVRDTRHRVKLWSSPRRAVCVWLHAGGYIGLTDFVLSVACDFASHWPFAVSRLCRCPHTSAASPCAPATVPCALQRCLR